MGKNKHDDANITIVEGMEHLGQLARIVRQKMFEITFAKFSPEQQQYIVDEMRKRNMIREV